MRSKFLRRAAAEQIRRSEREEREINARGKIKILNDKWSPHVRRDIADGILSFY